MKKQLANQEIAKIIERDNIITFKRKNQVKPSLKLQRQEQQEIQSFKSTPNEELFIQKNIKKNVPLPQLNRQRKRMIKSNIPQSKPLINPTYLEKQVRQHDNILLKNTNNSLTSQNMKLKTKMMNMEKQIIRLQKIIQEDPSKNKSLLKDQKFKINDSTSLKIALRNIQKQLQQTKKQKDKIKTTIKFTSIAQLQLQRDTILQQCTRLREMLDQQRNKLSLLRINQQGSTSIQNRFSQLQQRYNILLKQNNSLKAKLSKGQQLQKNSKFIQNQKNLNKMLFNARRTIRQKQKQVEFYKVQIRKYQSVKNSKVQSLKIIDNMSNSQGLPRTKQIKSQLSNYPQKNQRINFIKQKRTMSKSAQKYRSNNQKNIQCNNCKKLKQQISHLNIQLQKYKNSQLNNQNLNIQQIIKDKAIISSPQYLQKAKRFLVYRFKAHHLALQQAGYHFINYNGQIQNLKTNISIGQLLDIVMNQPFSLITQKYIQSFIFYLYYSQQNITSSFVIDQSKTKTKQQILNKFNALIGNFELLNNQKQEEMFIQIAELVTHYYQQILKALTDKRNSQSTISIDHFYAFFTQIQLQKQYIDFIITQIILQSLDLDHLNIYNVFQVFYMSPNQAKISDKHLLNIAQAQNNNKKYQMINTVVKQEDQQYEQSKSLLQSKVEKSNINEQVSPAKSVQNSQNNQKNQITDYDEKFEQQKMYYEAEQQKAEQQRPNNKNSHQHYQIQEQQQYIDQFQP